MWILSHVDSHEFYLKLHHGLLHALHVKDSLDQLLDGLGQLRLGASSGRQPLHCFLILSGDTNATRQRKPKCRQMQKSYCRMPLSSCCVSTCP